MNNKQNIIIYEYIATLYTLCYFMFYYSYTLYKINGVVCFFLFCENLLIVIKKYTNLNNSHRNFAEAGSILKLL